MTKMMMIIRFGYADLFVCDFVYLLNKIFIMISKQWYCSYGVLDSGSGNKAPHFMTFIIIIIITIIRQYKIQKRRA